MNINSLQQLLAHGSSRTGPSRVYRRRKAPFEEMPESEFRQKFRFSKSSFHAICEWLRTDLEPLSLSPTGLSVEQKVAATLRLLARNQKQSDTGELTGISQSSISRVFHEVIEVIDRKAAELIHWPSEEEQRVTETRIFARYKLPNIVGIIDGTPIHIIRPRLNEDTYVNRKGVHSINLGAIVDDKLRFIWINAEWPGSTHDSTVFRESKLYEALNSGAVTGTIVGDSAYRAERFLIKPHHNPPIGSAEARYNSSLCGLRARVEHAFGCTKRQFLILQEVMRYEPEFAVKVITSCLALRNFFILMKETDDFDLDESVIEHEGNNGNDGINRDGRTLMDFITMKYFS